MPPDDAVLLPIAAPAQDRTSHGAGRAGGHRDDPQLRNGDEPSAVPVVPKNARFAGGSQLPTARERRTRRLAAPVLAKIDLR
jgi:hypothetical protein